MQLYPFQIEDVMKIGRQRAGLIGSEMGTGKTHEAIALDEAWYRNTERAIGNGKLQTPWGKVPPTLVVAPLNTFDSWQEKYATQSPSSDVFVLDRKKREEFEAAVFKRKADVFLMHWEAVRLIPNLRKMVFNTLIGDEVHRISNKGSQQAQAFKTLKAYRKLGLSGTASGDQPVGLWSILNWLWPKHYSSYWNFDKFYIRKEVNEQGFKKVVGIRNAEILYEEMSPWYVRHLKRDQCCDHHPEGVMSWLPEKTYDRVWVDLSPQQRKVYDQMKDHMVAWVGEQEETPLSASIAIAQMTRLSQMALATPEISERWVNKRYPKGHEREGSTYEEMVLDVTLHRPSTKIDRVLEIVKDHPEKSFVVFSSSRKACYLLQEALKEAKISTEVLSGDTPQGQRPGMVKRFINKEYRIFIGVIAAAAEGIDGLQHATDTVIFMDRAWSTIKNKQAEDRLHRGGQKDTVSVIDIMARNTVDLGRHTKLDDKWSWIKGILEGNNVRSAY